MCKIGFLVRSVSFFKTLFFDIYAHPWNLTTFIDVDNMARNTFNFSAVLRSSQIQSRWQKKRNNCLASLFCAFSWHVQGDLGGINFLNIIVNVIWSFSRSWATREGTLFNGIFSILLYYFVTDSRFFLKSMWRFVKWIPHIIALFVILSSCGCYTRAVRVFTFTVWETK